MNETTEVSVDYNSTSYVNSSVTDYIPYVERPETYIVPVLFLIIFIVGVLGNGTLVVIFMRHRTMRNAPNTYILSLALADLLVIITVVPFTSVIYTVESWPWGELICKFSETAKDISVGVSIFTLTALAANRFFAIVDPLKKLHAAGSSSTKLTIAIAIFIWILAGICAVPSAIGTHLFPVEDDNGKVVLIVCYPFPRNWLNGQYPKVHVMTRFLIQYVIPLTIIALFYMSMANHLIVSTKNVPGEMQGTQRQIRARKKVAVTVLVFVLVFAISFLPYHIFMLFFYFDPNSQANYNAFWNALRIVGFCLFYLHSCLNPVALYWVSGAFRKHFNRYLLCIKPERNRCDTCQGNHATTISLMSTNKRNQSVCHRKGRPTSISRRQELLAGQETSITLLGNGHVNACSKM